MFDLIVQYKERVTTLQTMLPRLANVFHAMALIASYGEMVKIFIEKSPSHPEVARIPAYEDLMLAHFQQYARDHISVQENRIWDTELVGDESTLFAWQEAGYPMARDEDTYERRLEVWRAIWNNESVQIAGSYVNKKGKTVSYSLNVLPHSRGVGHPVADAETTIGQRNALFAETLLKVPFWLPLNYGTSIGGAEGYPSHGGLHFVDVAEQRMSTHIARFVELFETYCASLLDSDEPITVESAALYAATHIKAADIPLTIDVPSLALQVAQQ